MCLMVSGHTKWKKGRKAIQVSIVNVTLLRNSQNYAIKKSCQLT